MRYAPLAGLGTALALASLSSPARGQAAIDSVRARPETVPARVEPVTPGPLFFADTAADGRWVDARSAAELLRHITLRLIGVPLPAAVDAIAQQAGLGAQLPPELVPLGARVSLEADDVTVAAALAHVLTNAGLDVLVGRDGQLTLVSHAVVSAEADSSRVVAGTLVDAASGEAVPYGTVALLGTDHARFADAAGRFRLTRIAPRAYRLRARQIGYQPVDTTVVLGPGPSVVTLTLAMRRLPALLHPVEVAGRANDCVATGMPDSILHPTLAAIFAQVRENIDRNRLLQQEYPFTYLREERRVLHGSNGRNSTAYVDSLSYESRSRRLYREGAVVFDQADTLIHRTSAGARMSPVVRRHLYLPSFGDLADSAFLAAHCFTLGLTERDRHGPTAYRIDFQPAVRIRTPDVTGSIYVDARRLVVERVVLAMTRPQAAMPPVLSFTASATFREVVPLVPVVDSIGSVQVLAIVGGLQRPMVDIAVTTDRMLELQFEAARPDETAQPAPARVGASASGPMAQQGSSDADSTIARKTSAMGLHRVRPVLARGESCELAPPSDTIAALLWATVQSSRPKGIVDTTWVRFARSVLGAVRESFILPPDLPIAVFSSPFPVGASERVADAGEAPPTGAGAGEAALLPPISDGPARSTPAAAPSDSSGTLAGMVLSEGDGWPVAFAMVSLVGGSERHVTDTSGAWRVPRVAPGQYTVRVRGIGYAPKDTMIVVHPGAAVTTDTIRIARVAAHLAPVTVQGQRPPLYITPMVSTVAVVTLDADGLLTDGRVAASSGSEAADTLVLRAIERAALAHRFPTLRRANGVPSAVTLELLVSTNEPLLGADALALGRVQAPIWPSQHEAALTDGSLQPRFLGNLRHGDPGADTATLEFVVDERGQALPSTARVDPAARLEQKPDYAPRLEQRVLQKLMEFRFTPATIGTCRVREFITQGFGYRIEGAPQ